MLIKSINLIRGWFLKSLCLIQTINFLINNIKKDDAVEKNPYTLRDIIATLLQAKTLYLIKRESISLESIEELKSSLRKLGADDNKVMLWTWNLDLLYFMKQNDVDKATELCSKLTLMYKGLATYLMLYKLICENNAHILMYLYYLENKEYLEATLKTLDEQKQYYMFSLSSYCKNKQKALCS